MKAPQIPRKPELEHIPQKLEQQINQQQEEIKSEFGFRSLKDNYNDVFTTLDTSTKSENEPNQPENIQIVEPNQEKANQEWSSWRGEILHPPNKKSVSSRCWRFGGFRMDINGILDTTQTVCGLCGKEMAYSASPGAFTKHLKKKHFFEYSEETATLFEDNAELEEQGVTEDILNTFEKDSVESQKQDFWINHKSSKSPKKIAHPSWKGETLYPPVKKTRKEPSKAWRFGGFRKGHKGNLMKLCMVCGLCGMEMIYDNSPSGLIGHLKRKHKEVWYGGVGEEDGSLKEDKIENRMNVLSSREGDVLLTPTKYAGRFPFDGFEKQSQEMVEELCDQNKVEDLADIGRDMVMNLGGKWQCKVCARFENTEEQITNHAGKHLKKWCKINKSIK